MFETILHVAAAAEYEDALARYATRDAGTAERFAVAVAEARAMIARFPEAFELLDDTHTGAIQPAGFRTH